MKLSFKFFIVAYIIVLLAAGIPSAVFIENQHRAEWSAKEERLLSGVSYARSSFYSLSELWAGELSDRRLNEIAGQIRVSLDADIEEFGIERYRETAHTDIKVNEGKSFYFEKEGELIMEAVCKVNVEGSSYLVFARSYFNKLKAERGKMWRYYTAAMITVAAVSGILLFIIAKRVTKPLEILQKAADKIAGGSYGETADIKTADIEIKRLADSFNIMSKATENALLSLREEADRRERFVANFTHEMKTPMTSIVGYAQLINGYELSERERRQAADVVYKEGKRLEALSRQLLELFVTKNEKPEQTRLSLLRLGARISDTMRFSAEKYGCTLTCTLPDALISGNEPLLLSLFYNLIDNGFKACPPGGNVSVTGEERGDLIYITVKDTGRGIAAEHLPRLTEPFYREDKARSRRQGGAGIGLALSKEIALLHGTELSFKSEQGRGTAVSFALRRAVAK